MVNHNKYVVVACALLFFGAQQSFAQRFLRTKTAQVNNFVDISSEDALRDVIKKHPVVVIKAYSPKCPHCIQYEGAFNAAAQSLKNEAHFVAYNANNKEFDKFSDEYDVESLPTTLIFVNGVLKTKKIGGMSQDALATEINKVAAVKKEMPSRLDIDDMDEDDSFDDMDLEEDVIVVTPMPAPKPIKKPTPAPIKKDVVVKKVEHKGSCCPKKQVKPVCPKPEQKPESPKGHGGIKKVATQSAYDALIGQPGLVVVKFYGVWCGPCKAMAPRFEKIAATYADKAAFVEIDVDLTDEDLHAVVEENAPTLPRILFIKNGQIVEKLGNAPDHVLESLIQKHTK
jgi:thioredoxin 1